MPTENLCLFPITMFNPFFCVPSSQRTQPPKCVALATFQSESSIRPQLLRPPTPRRFTLMASATLRFTDVALWRLELSLTAVNVKRNSPSFVYASRTNCARQTICVPLQRGSPCRWGCVAALIQAELATGSQGVSQCLRTVEKKFTGYRNVLCFSNLGL